MTKIIASLILTFISISAFAQQPPMRMWYDRPAQYFEESLPIGNGKLGGLVYGDPFNDSIIINDITLWTGKPVDHQEGEGASVWLPEIRKALFREDYRLADSLQHHLQGHNSQFYQPLAILHIDNNDIDRPTVCPSGYYRRSLDLDSSIVKIDYSINDATYHREYFASNPDKLIAIRLTTQDGEINNLLSMTSLVPHKVKYTNNQIVMTGHATGEENESTHFCTIVKVIPDDGITSASAEGISLRGCHGVTIYIVNETSFNGALKHPVRQGADYINNANDDLWHLANYSYKNFRDRHIADYRQFFSRMTLHLDGANTDDRRTTDQQLKDYTDKGEKNKYLETLYFQYGRYLLISCSRTEGVPANLQGLWTPHLWSPWRGNYTVNINLEENYWPAEVANLPEMTKPLDGFISALAENGRFTAKNYYGINRGWCSSHNSDIWAMTNPVGEGNEMPEWANWNMGGAWLVNTLWDHYLFSKDINYLRTTALPLMRGAALFCLDWLIPNSQNTRELITAPSTSPENEYKTPQGYHGMTCYGGTADLAIIRELFANTLKAMAVCGETKTKEAKSIGKAFRRLHPYTIGAKGDLNEWYYDWEDWDPHHRHQSHLIGLYPGSHINYDKSPQLAEAARQTLIQKGDQTTGWSTGWRINLWARLNDGKQAYHIFRKLLTFVTPDNYKGDDQRRSGGTYPNLMDAHPPFQIDGNFGGTAGVCEMLMQSDCKNIRLLPALPQEWSAGDIRGIRARGGFTLDFKWNNGRVTQATIHSKQGGTTTIHANGIIKTVSVSPNSYKDLIF
ncbi:MAG: glycoside hydrolase family 95 protein [Prevotella sp.]|nr:glycoside hydrolase family 95 protein [Prevotella sp.]